MSKKIILATHNTHKRREMREILSELDIELVSLDDYPEIGDIPENGSTLDENAQIKARTVHQLTGLPALADDTGLEVDELDGAPGVYSARYAGPQKSSRDNVKKLLAVLKNVPAERRRARFRTTIAYVDQTGELLAEGSVEGRISHEPKGLGGFGYDPVFYIPESGKTFAEMNSAEKHAISHRGRAIRSLCDLLKRHLTCPPPADDPPKPKELA